MNTATNFSYRSSSSDNSETTEDTKNIIKLIGKPLIIPIMCICPENKIGAFH